MFSAIFGPVVELAKGWLEGRRKVQVARIKTAEAVEERRAQQASEQGQRDSDWELENIKQSGKFSRRVTMLFVFLPIVVTTIWPEHGKQLWENMRLVPQEWWTLTGLVVGGVYGYRKAPEILGKIAQALRRPTQQTATG